MKFIFIFVVVFIVVFSSVVVLLVLVYVDYGKFQYGGIYGEVGIFQLELVVVEYMFIFYVILYGELIFIKGVSGKVIIFGVDGSSSEVQLVVVGDNQLVVKIQYKFVLGSKIFVVVLMLGKLVVNICYVIE